MTSSRRHERSKGRKSTVSMDFRPRLWVTLPSMRCSTRRERPARRAGVRREVGMTALPCLEQ